MVETILFFSFADIILVFKIRLTYRNKKSKQRCPISLWSLSHESSWKCIYVVLFEDGIIFGMTDFKGH